MAKLIYHGDSRKTFQWDSMGKHFSYIAEPNQELIVPDNQVMYLLSFGNFEEVPGSPVIPELPKKRKVLDKIVRVDPFIKIEPKKVEAPIAVVTPIVETPVEKPVEVIAPVLEIGDIPLPEVAPVAETSVTSEVESEEVTEEKVEEPVIEKVEKKVKKIDYTSFKKNELKKLCKDMGLDTSGNRDDLIARILNNQ